MSSKAGATLLFTLSLGQVGLCFPTGQAIHVLDDPAKVLSPWSVADDPIDRLQQTGTEDIFDWINMDSLDHLIEWDDIEPLQIPSNQAHHSEQEREPLVPTLPPFEESALERPVDYSEILTTVNHEGQDAYHPTHSHYPYQVKNPSQIPEDNQNLVQQGTGSCNPQEKIYSQYHASESSLAPAQCSLTGPSHFQSLPTGPSLSLNPHQALANHAQCEQHMTHIKDQAISKKKEDLEWQDRLYKRLKRISKKNIENPLLEEYIKIFRKNYADLPFVAKRIPKTDIIDFVKLPVQVVRTLLIDWLIKEISNPNGSLPVSGLIGKSPYPMNENSFGHVQKVLLNFFSKPISKEDCIATCLSILKVFPDSSLYSFDFLTSVPETETASLLDSRHQLFQKAINSFNLQEKIESKAVSSTINGFLLLAVNNIPENICPEKCWKDVSGLMGKGESSMFQRIQECLCIPNQNHTQKRFGNLPAHLLSIKKSQIGKSTQNIPSSNIVEYIRITDEAGEILRPSSLIKRAKFLVSNLIFFQNLLFKYLLKGSRFENLEGKFMDWIMGELLNPKGSLPVLGKVEGVTQPLDKKQFGGLQVLVINHLSVSTSVITPQVFAQISIFLNGCWFKNFYPNEWNSMFSNMNPSGRVGLCSPIGQATHVLDKPAEVSTWIVGDDLTDGLPLSETEDISKWLNMDALDNPVEWHDIEPMQNTSHQAHHSEQGRELMLPLLPRFEESGLEGPFDSSGVPSIVHHAGRDVCQPSPTHSHHSHNSQNPALMAECLFNLQSRRSHKLEENIQSKHWVSEPSLMTHIGPSHYQSLPTGPSVSLNPHEGPAASARIGQHVNPIQEMAVDSKIEDLEWQSLKTGRIGFGKLPVQIVKSVGLVRPAKQNGNEPIRKQRFLDYMENLINWITFISTLPTRKLYTRKYEYTVPTQVINWLIKEIFDPDDSLPVLGTAKTSTYPMDESAFGDLQKILINFFSKHSSKEDYIRTCLSILKYFPSTSHHNLDFIYNFSKPERQYQFMTKDQMMMKEIHSFQLHKRILFSMGQNRKLSGLKRKRKAQNHINENKKIKMTKS
ncbi:hypothetical protein PSHT_07478 [Puccinia striiformis]|uniref:Uncharacterized protein n=1 Tax=Puccinia striiformis TaxID=27350 RepID=A0A2S4VXG5_9BASI|nr:hypothetical protein PSHT_07478 [Puccinia striiformis]